jgi:hypothetical protein
VGVFGCLDGNVSGVGMIPRGKGVFRLFFFVSVSFGGPYCVCIFGVAVCRIGVLCRLIYACISTRRVVPPSFQSSQGEHASLSIHVSINHPSLHTHRNPPDQTHKANVHTARAQTPPRPYNSSSSSMQLPTPPPTARTPSAAIRHVSKTLHLYLTPLLLRTLRVAFPPTQTSMSKARAAAPTTIDAV